MTSPCIIVDPDTNQAAKVSQFGQLISAPIAYSDASAKNLDAVGTAFNLAIPEHGKGIVITDVIASANNTVSNTAPADIIIYESDAANSLTELAVIVRPQLTRAGNFILTGLNLLTPNGVWINAKTSDNSVLVTLMFYRVGF
jgi:hypothetical protein